MFFKKYGDVIVSVFYLLLATAVIVMARALPKSAIISIGPEFMPTVIGVFTLILALILLVTSLKDFKSNAAKLAAGEAIEAVDYKRVISSFIVIIAYVMILQPIGFIVSTIVYLPLQMFILAPADKRSVKDIIQLIILAVIFTLVVFFLFRYGFKIILPTGIFTINL